MIIITSEHEEEDSLGNVWAVGTIWHWLLSGHWVPSGHGRHLGTHGHGHFWARVPSVHARARTLLGTGYSRARRHSLAWWALGTFWALGTGYHMGTGAIWVLTGTGISAWCGYVIVCVLFGHVGIHGLGGHCPCTSGTEWARLEKSARRS